MEKWLGNKRENLTFDKARGKDVKSKRSIWIKKLNELKI